MRVGLEMRHLSGIAVHVVEVRAIGVEHDELFLAFPGQYLVEDGQQVGVIVVAVLARGFGQLTASGVGVARLEEEPLVGLFAQEVDERVVGALIAQKHGVEACLTEGLQDAFLVEETLEVGGRSQREEHGHTLVGGVRLGGDSSTSKILSLKTESATMDTINHGHVEIVSSSSDGVYGQMYYMSNIESVSGNIEEPNISGENVSLYKAEISENKRLNIVATDEVELEDVTFKGEFPKTTANAIAKINGGKTVTLTNVVFDDTVKGYNGFEIGLNSNDLPKRVDIKNCDFKGKLNNNAILIFGTDNDAVINIENCHFADISNALRLSNKTNSKNVTVNIKDCVVDKWDSRKEWEGFLICEDYTSPDLNSAEANNLFAPEKIHVNFINLIYQGEKITPDTDKKIYYVYYDNGGEQTDENKLPKVVIS